ncbi:MAG: hypothetical protein KGY80_09190 [Candidatus Thorarchaeota archaeon]|nr:hypothetical protein [Candidatus Thorarchaeota archaeon]
MRDSTRALRIGSYCLLLLVLVNLFLPLSSHHRADESNTQYILSEDIVRPEIASWNFTKEARRGEDFEVWAEVSDTESGVKNVSLVVEETVSNRILYPLSFNSSLYTAQIPALEVNRTYELFIRAFDNANNSATSYRRSIDLRIATTTRINPNVTFLPVVVSSSIVAVTVIVLAYFYDTKYDSI